VRKLSHLAYIALGVVAEKQPCSGYAVMKDFQSSSSTYFSGSAGAIYPLMKRLEADGLTKVDRTKAGTRTRRNYTITDKGRDALETWLASPIPDEEVAFLVDLLRTRVLFFERLTKQQRRKFVKDCREQLRSRIAATQKRMKAKNALSQFEQVTLASVLMIDEARIKWLDVVERELCS
jgi:DNA-binding PadR family transcriptional regulator